MELKGLVWVYDRTANMGHTFHKDVTKGDCSYVTLPNKYISVLKFQEKLNQMEFGVIWRIYDRLNIKIHGNPKQKYLKRLKQPE